MLSPRLIALEGFGGTPRLVAVRGLAPFGAPPPSPLPNDAHDGIGYWSDAAWRRAKRLADEDDVFAILWV